MSGQLALPEQFALPVETQDTPRIVGDLRRRELGPVRRVYEQISVGQQLTASPDLAGLMLPRTDDAAFFVDQFRRMPLVHGVQVVARVGALGVVRHNAVALFVLFDICIADIGQGPQTIIQLQAAGLGRQAS